MVVTVRNQCCQQSFEVGRTDCCGRFETVQKGGSAGTADVDTGNAEWYSWTKAIR